VFDAAQSTDTNLVEDELEVLEAGAAYVTFAPHYDLQSQDWDNISDKRLICGDS
jgi:hypothetical protein